MPVEGKKSLPIKIETHKAIAHQSVETGKDMYELVDESWNVYEELTRACDQLGLTMEELLRDMYTLFSNAKSAVAPPRPAPAPSPLDLLTPDQIRLVQGLIEILLHQPEGDIFRSLESVLTEAVNQWHKASHHQALTATSWTAELLSHLPAPAKLSELDLQAFGRLLRILQSNKPGLRDAILSNLTQFEDTDTLYGQRRSDPAAELPASIESRTGERDRNVADLQRDTGQLAAGITETHRRLDEATKHGANRQRGQKKTPRKAR